VAAGDVLFIGWTGGSPNYKELAPQIQIEPSDTPGFINKRVTINRICFDKDKAAVIGNLPTGNAALSSVYIDTDGSVKTQALGGGYKLLSVSDASIAKGFSRVSAQYNKSANGIFDIGLPSGFSVDQVGGVCRIKYLTHVLEEFDSGTGVEGTGLELKILQDLIYLNQEIEPVINQRVFAMTKRTGQTLAVTFHESTSITYSIYADFFIQRSSINPQLFKYAENLLGVRFGLFCNNVQFETIDLSMGEIPGNFGTAVEANTIDVVRTSQEDANATGQIFVDSGDYSSFTTQQLSTYYIRDTGKSPAPFTAYSIIVRKSLRYLHTPSVNKSLLYPRWESSGNVHKIMIGLKAWREYDITGLA
jgi:hypothetical protein